MTKQNPDFEIPFLLGKHVGDSYASLIEFEKTLQENSTMVKKDKTLRAEIRYALTHLSNKLNEVIERLD